MEQEIKEKQEIKIVRKQAWLMKNQQHASFFFSLNIIFFPSIVAIKFIYFPALERNSPHILSSNMIHHSLFPVIPLGINFPIDLSLGRRFLQTFPIL